MGRGVLHIVLAVSAAVAIGGSVISARAATWFEKNFWLSGPRYDSDVPLCEDHGPLDKIVARFSTKEGRFWNSALTIVGFEKIREVAWEPWSSGTMPRRYCVASVLVSDGKWRQINYAIIEDGQHRGEISPRVDSPAVAALIVSLLEGSLMLSRLQKSMDPLDVACAHLSEYIETNVRA